MNRRALLTLWGGWMLTRIFFFPKDAFAQRRKLDRARYILIHDRDGADYRPLLAAASHSLSAAHPGWEDELVVLELHEDAAAVRETLAHYAPRTQSFAWPTLLAVPTGNFPDVEVWTPGWLDFYGRRDGGGCYPISGGWWSVEGDWHPSKEKVRKHIDDSPNHVSGNFLTPWLMRLSFEELQSLHSDHHREMTKAGKVSWDHVNAENCLP